MGSQPQVSPAQLNQIARTLIQQNSIEMTQQIFATTINPAQSNVVNVIPRNVGLIKGFIVEVAAVIHNSGAGAALVPTQFSTANILSQVTFYDLNNNTRIQTAGWHLEMVNSIKSKRVFGSALLQSASDSPMEYGSNWNVIGATQSIGAGTDGTITMRYYVPLAYSDTDYRGSVYANVVNATMNLQLTVNPNPVAVGGDTTLACYSGNTGSCTSCTISVYQVYMDQIPAGNGGPVLPLLDLSTIYELKNVTFSAIVAQQDYPIQYANFRDFLSTFAVFYNGAARTNGTDVNYFSLQAANFTNIWKVNPQLVALKTRNLIQQDLPTGAYYFSSRTKPISTTQYGNMELVLNASTATSGAYCLIGYEDFALINALTQAGSLPAS
jgi:P3 major capsid protein